MDTDWIKRRIVREYGSLAVFAGGIRLLSHPLMSESALRAALDGSGELWDDEVRLISTLLEADHHDVQASISIARVMHRFGQPSDRSDQVLTA